MWISDAVTPTSVAFGFSLLDCAVAGAMPVAASAASTTAIATTLRSLVTFPPRSRACEFRSQTRSRDPRWSLRDEVRLHLGRVRCLAVERALLGGVLAHPLALRELHHHEA